MPTSPQNAHKSWRVLYGSSPPAAHDPLRDAVDPCCCKPLLVATWFVVPSSSFSTTLLPNIITTYKRQKKGGTSLQWASFSPSSGQHGMSVGEKHRCEIRLACSTSRRLKAETRHFLWWYAASCTEKAISKRNLLLCAVTPRHAT